MQEELDTLRTLPYAELLTRTNGNVLGISNDRGPWKTKTVTTPPSGTKVYAMETAQTAIIEETGIAVLPGNYRGDFTLSVKVNALATSPAGWGAGVAFRYRDTENHYRFRFASGGIALDKIQQGIKTTLWSQSATYNTGTWYTLDIIATGSSLVLKKNGTTLTTITDTTFTMGDLALLTLNGAKTYFDDVAVTENSVTTTWNFDTQADGTIPSDWQRLSALDLPSGSETLTIANYLSDSNITKATVTISWKDAGSTRSITGSTLIAK